ncbi:MAG: hypothetical protein AAF666_08385 [Pseudomonadota bacterium]
MPACEHLVDVGWRNCSAQASLAFFPPEPLTGRAAEDAAPMAAALGARILQVRCPFNLRLRRSPPNVRPAGFKRIPEEDGLSQVGMKGLVTPIAQNAQRNPAIPAMQISLNMMLVTEEECALNLTSPFFAPNFRDWPGTLVSGRFPLRSWPRPLNAVLEWQDQDDWVLRRGDPIAYLWLHFDDPDKVPNLVEASLTPALRRHFAAVDNVSTFGRNVGPMFAQAAERRPERLLVPKVLGCPEFSD